MDDELFKMSGPIPANFDAEKADNLEDVRHRPKALVAWSG
jgi:hypothetical protein